MTSDKSAATHSFYSSRAATYSADTVEYGVSSRLIDFCNLLKSGDRVLEIGCGSGRDSAWMLSQGLDVHPTDGIAEMAGQASVKLGIPVQVLPFDQIDYVDDYQAVWANACLLHVSRVELPDVLQRVQRALKPGGLFYASFKAGTAEGTDEFGRYYNYPDQDWLTNSYGDGWSSIDIVTEDGGGYDGKPTRWLYVLARKTGLEHE